MYVHNEVCKLIFWITTAPHTTLQPPTERPHPLTQLLSYNLVDTNDGYRKVGENIKIIIWRKCFAF